MNFFYLEMLANNKLLVPLAFILPVIYDGIFFMLKLSVKSITLFSKLNQITFKMKSLLN